MIVGSRLQALILASIAVALPVGVREWWTAPVAVALAAWALAIVVRRVDLGPDSVRHRRLVLGTAQSTRTDAAAQCGHRYLELRIPGARPGRIEVPVEIRPQVRAWAEVTSPELHPGAA